MPDQSVQCLLCRHRCHIASGAYGRCRVRRNEHGTLYALTYGLIVAEHVDPIEKKPLFHFLPGSRTYSIATIGCNFRCLNCQNHSIAQFDIVKSGGVPGEFTRPEDVVNRALQSGCRSISFTYTEPTVFLEYLLDIARLSCEAGLKNILVTNGYISPEALQGIGPFIHAANIDLKGFTEDFYQRVAGATLAGVLECIEEFYSRGIWIELTTLLIPGENDDERHADGIAGFIAGKLGVDIPWHISRFFPQHKMPHYPATSPESMSGALAAGVRKGLRYVYEGNLQSGREDTLCPQCGTAVIVRRGWQTWLKAFDAGRCGMCGTVIAGVW